MKKIISLGLLLLGVGMMGVSTVAESVSQYENPVFEPVLADPTLIRAEDGTFYAYGTEDDWGDGAGPHLIPILRSDNMTEWEYVDDAFASKPDWKEEGGLWAPHIAYHQGTYLLYYSMSTWGDPNPGIGVATASHPAGPFQDQGPLFTSEEIGVDNSIDPMFFVDDGKPTLIWGSFHGIYGIRLSDDGLKTEGEKFPIAGNAFEAPYLIKRDGNYYLFVSLGSCCEGESSTYHVAVGRAEAIEGPYRDREGNDLLHSNGSPVLVGDQEAEKEKRFVGPGHNAVFRDDDGTDWIVYHGIDPTNPYLLGGATRRPLLIDRLRWKDGWPQVEGLVPSTEPMTGPVWK
ncbi:family 43 glycosylhydrolase [Desmospora activa]|uniref:Arabinan endo-1,5-alpha-L-arabinosidase n=1 Tax=Desmospora activa DSM 45169 TaxID=1121389 RepID=A0A2T4Z7I9_9BACL|nr:family 43 glycosylhydrolase [Desmospora activa]PTM57843.1 arabinan endo-1,5-alpha-L-arabinosidase [Desmospora activa DSM 45169]